MSAGRDTSPGVAAEETPVAGDEVVRIRGDELDHVGWIRFDGDEYHDFRYYRPGDAVQDLLAEGWLPVWVHVPDDLDLAPRGAIGGRR